MPTTLNPTAARILDVNLPLAGYGLGEAQLEVVRRLKENLPDVIALFNTRNSLTGNAAIPQPAGYKVAPNAPADEDINQILVGVSEETMIQGIGGPYKNEIEVAVFSINYRIEVARQVIQHWQRAELVRAVLHAFKNKTYDEAERMCWASLTPSGLSMLPISEREYSGVVATFRMVIPPPTT